jgi:hypothetical protein
MGRAKEPGPAKLFMSLIFSDEVVFGQALEELRLAYGAMDFMSERLPFHFTDYYTREMGSPLFRHLVTFASLIARASLPEIKQATNRLEEKLSPEDHHRRINIDPGYLCYEHVILATTKAYTHRPYLRDGVYADLTLIYRNKSFQPLEWTYPDYGQDPLLGLLNQIRKKYAAELNKKEPVSC